MKWSFDLLPLNDPGDNLFMIPGWFQVLLCIEHNTHPVLS